MSAVAAAFGKIAALLPGYRQRAGQLEYAEAVAKAVADGGKLLIEGPTGTGKSLGYLVPAIVSGKKVLVVTANISLQDQLIDKDLPLIARALGAFPFAILKGRGNYLCLRKSAAVENGGGTSVVEEGAILTWGRMTTTGDRKELPIAPTGPAWAKFSTNTDECLGHDCEHAAKCFALRAQALAKTAQVIVANYHLLYLHAIVLAATDGEVKLLPDHDVLVLDEAHEAATIARNVFGFDLSGHAVRRLSKMVEAIDEGAPIAKRIADGAADFFAGLAAFCRAEREPRRRIRTANVVAWRPLHAALLDAAVLLGREAGEHASAGNHADARFARNGARKASEHAANIFAAMSGKGGEMTYFAEESRGGATLSGRPLDVAPYLSPVLSRARTTIVTSATLAAGGDFALVASELGIAASEKIVASPFDLKAQMAVVIPKMPEPSHRDYRAAADDAIRAAVKAAGGRTLILCTSNAGVAAAAKALDGCGFRVLRQGDMPTAMLVEEFRDDVSSVLVGTTSLWRGTDVSGEALSCVVIDKLPFEAWGDPIVEALREHDGDQGWNRYLARAIVQFRQGVGRLIRNEADRGAIVVLDGRLHTKPYASKFLRSFVKGTGFSMDVTSVAKFLGGAR